MKITFYPVDLPQRSGKVCKIILTMQIRVTSMYKVIPYKSPRMNLAGARFGVISGN